ncbi:MAG: aminopeptidase P family protein [Deltaproteobacteria bacterium]|nr:aminopeptidase P family protein [Deltaproteobacteria bacterium]
MTGGNKIAPFSEIERRILLLQEAMQKKDVDGVLVLQKTDLFYFAATSQQGYLYVPVEGRPLLMVFRDFGRAVSESPLADIVSLASVKKIPQLLSDHGYPPPRLLGMELDVLPANLYFFYSKLFEQGSITDISTDIRLIRAVKSEFEIGRLRQSALLSDKVAAKVPELLVPGKTEVEVAGELEGYARSLGHQGIVRMRLWGSELFYGHLMSGSAAAVPSYLSSPTGGEGVSGFVGQGAGFKKICRNEPVLVDYVFAFDGYISDHARIFSIGTLSADLLDAHQAMLEVQDETKNLAKPGMVTGELYEMMVSMALKRGYGDHFMGVGEKRIRFTGHGVGLELDEFPFIAKGQKLELQAGMIIALEPKTIFPGKGVVGIENTHLVTEKGLESLTKISDEITVVSG